MKYLSLILAIAFHTLLSAQNIDVDGGATYAVVIGVSDYQDPAIPDLRFSNRDAEAFANYLRSPAGGGLDNDHLKVLLNEQATAGRVAEALDALIEQVKEGDRVIIYFSGHGDVERKTVSQPGFLLCWDAPSRVYMGGGTYSLAFLQEIVTTLSTQNLAKVTVITDACHAGKLAGNQIGGSQLTSANLAKQYANEVKILSCQPGEFALEGEQWGGGRGVFSFHLIDAMYGLADRNADGTVTLGEIDRYLEDHVTAEAAPQSQVPMLLGNKMEQLAKVNPAVLSDLQKHKASGLLAFAATESRGFEDEVLAKVDTTVREMYRAFKLAVQKKQFFSPVGNSADDYYAQLTGVEALAPLRGIMKRNYAAALQDDAQQTLNEWLKTNQDATIDAAATERLPQKVFTEKVRSYPRCLDRAAELLGEKHYMYPALKSRQYFFEGYLLANSSRNPNRELGERALGFFRQSLSWQPEQPHVYWQMSRVFGYNFLQPDSLVHYSRHALEIHPNWAIPCTDAAFALCYKYKWYDQAKIFLDQATQIDSGSAEVWNAWATFNFGKKNLREAERQILKALRLDSTDNIVWNNLGYLYQEEPSRIPESVPALQKAIALDSTYAFAWSNLGATYNMMDRYAEAEPVLRKAIALDSTLIYAWNNLGYMYQQTNHLDESVKALQKAIALDSTYAFACSNLGYTYNTMDRYAEAELVLKKAIALDSTLINAWNNLGYSYLQTRRYVKAEQPLQKAVALDSTYTTARSNLGLVYLNLGRYAEAESELKKAIALDSTYANPRRHLGMVCFKTNRPDEARQNFLKAIELNPNNAAAILGMAYLFASNLPAEDSSVAEVKKTSALSYVEQAIIKGRNFKQLEQDEDLAPLRATPEWKALLKKYFPEASPDPSKGGEKKE